MKIVIFGASGGCARSATVEAVKAGHEVTVLLRDPSKLELEDTTLKQRLTKVQGNALNLEDVKKVIENQDVIISSLGGKPIMGITGATLDNPTICADAMKTLQQAVSQVANPPKRIVVVSTTGIGEKRDVPYLLVPLYMWLLHRPLVDKANMEKILETVAIPEKIVVKPTLLTDGAATNNINAGEDAIGYSISRADVGIFLVKECLASQTWVNKKVLLTS
ncbi:hypothetical protein BZG36_00514 [Bifiguratus adelaidae]|uniref:NAD(P)-binding domain-containing protein n=1 Tax=Bifiguratus adelaidae TaxID=1938954 RepID=A0A261Y7C2_9FUNG|nr:hypothetical protein BZG36_00514 [Bifiguratus adelaidae]